MKVINFYLKMIPYLDKKYYYFVTLLFFYINLEKSQFFDLFHSILTG
jgi:hypothetical protein